MKLLLVYPSTLDAQNNPVKYRKAHIPPLSLATIAGLTPRQHTVRIVNDLVEEIDYAAGWDLVGLTAMTPQAERAYQVADEFRRRGVKVVMGGIHASTLPQEAKSHVDAVVIGEADRIWPEVLADCEQGRLQEFYEDPDLPDLAQTPLPRWDCLDLGIYVRRFGAKYPMMPISTTRGCPFGCRFCAVTRFSGKTYRMRPVASVLAEIEATKARNYFIVDDNIAAKPDYSRELFRALEGKGLRWMSQASTTILKNPDLLDLAARAGCFGLFVGVESLSKESLAAVGKSFNKAELYEQLVARMRQAGILPIMSFIFGFDQDHQDQFEVTANFVRKNHLASAVFWILTPVPGTELYEEMKRDGRMTAANWSQYDGTHVVYQPKSWSPTDLHARYWKIFRELYRPANLPRNIMWYTSFSKRPGQAFVRGCFIQPYFSRKVHAGEHPYSGGIGRLVPAVTDCG